MDNNSVKTLLIAIPTNDGITVFPGMLGMARYFFIYKTLNDRQFTLIEKRSNAYENTMQHLKTLDVYKIINDCNVIIASRVGKKGAIRLGDKGMKIFLKKGNIRDALTSVLYDKSLENK